VQGEYYFYNQDQLSPKENSTKNPKYHCFCKDYRVSKQKEVSILVATSQPAMRKGLKMLLGDQHIPYIVAEAQDSHELLKKIEATCPLVILLDWDLLDRATPILIKTICNLDQDTSLIVLSPKSEHQQLALEAGADHFVNISQPPRELQNIINNIVQSGNLDQSDA
jgi:DNA-binding NarL/FixJ family response regulator